MDDNWGNILYIIVMVLFVLVGALKKKKPPVAVSPPDDGELAQSPTQPVDRSLESMLEVLLGKEVAQPYYQPIEKRIEEEEYIIEDENVLDVKEPVVLSSENRKNTTFSDLKLLYDQNEDDSDEIDWQKAIIYKEILDRKYN